MPEPLKPARAELPAHPDRVDDAEPDGGSRWAGIVSAALLGALVVVIIVLHLTRVVGPGAH